MSSDLAREMRYTGLTDTMVTGSRGTFAGSEYGLDAGFIADADLCCLKHRPVTGALAKLEGQEIALKLEVHKLKPRPVWFGPTKGLP